MYAENGKISSRQTFRLYVFDLMGIATLLLPPYLAKLCGGDGVFAILAGTLLGILYLFYLGWLMKQMGTDMCSYLREHSTIFVQKLVFFLVMAHSIFTAGFCAFVFANLMQYSLIREISFTLVLVVLLLVSAYAVSGGIESRARVYEVLFWFVLIPYGGMMLASIRNFEMVYVDDFFITEGKNLLKGIYLVFLFLTPLFFSLFLIGEKEKNYGRNIVKTVLSSIVVSSVILFVSYILLLGNFGANALAEMRYPVVTLMSTIQFKGNFLKRMDALMLAVWFFTLYALLNLHLHYGIKMLKELFTKQDSLVGGVVTLSKNIYVKWWQIAIPTVLAFGIAWFMEQSKAWVWTFLNYYSYVGVPLLVVGPILLLGFPKKRKKQE